MRSWPARRDWKGKKLQVHGYVVPGSIGKKRDTLEYRFDIQRNGKMLRAYYTGIVPDTFKDDSEVVLTGSADAGRLRRHRHDGEVPVEVRGGATAACSAQVGRSWPPSATTCCSPPSSSCAYAAAMSVAGARRRSRPLIESGIGAFYLLAAIMAAASAVIVYAFVTGDYSIKYVQRYSDSAQPLFYKLTSYWGGLDGSIMFWVFLLSLFGSAAVYINRERHRELIPYVVAVISVVEMFFLFLMIVHNNPFETFLTENPTDGAGLNPLLQNFYMVIHPPTMYLGFVGLHDSVRLRHGRADHRLPGRLVAARRPPLDDDRVAVPVDRPRPRHDLGVRGARVGRLLDVGSGRERGPAAVVHGHRVPALGDGAGAARHAARVERLAGHPDVLPDDLRHVHDAVGHRAVGALVR